jgi:hypothetical protein
VQKIQEYIEQQLVVANLQQKGVPASIDISF